jgi:transient receptor potential cation channel subfamily C member 4
MWYDGLPGFRRLNPVSRLFAVAKLGAMFPLNSFIYMMAPNTKKGQFMTKPFVKFVSHSASYAFFLSILHIKLFLPF